MCFCLVGDGVLWCRLSDRLGEEHKGQLSERRLDRLYLQRDTESETLKVNMKTQLTILFAVFIMNDLSVPIFFFFLNSCVFVAFNQKNYRPVHTKGTNCKDND